MGPARRTRRSGRRGVASAACVIFDMRRASSPQRSGPLRRRCLVRIARLTWLSRRVDQGDRPPSCSPPNSAVVPQPSCSPPISTVVPLEGEKDPRSNGAPDRLVERRAIGTASWCINPGYGRVPAVGGGPALTPTAVSRFRRTLPTSALHYVDAGRRNPSTTPGDAPSRRESCAAEPEPRESHPGRQAA